MKMHYLSDEEKENKPKITSSLLKRIWKYLKPYKMQLLFVFVIILVSSIIGMFPSIITGKIVDEALLNKNLSLLIKYIFFAILCICVSQIITVLEVYINAWISHHIIYDMKNEMFQHLQRMSQDFFTNERQGEIITRMNSDIQGVCSIISNTLSEIVSDLLIVSTSVWMLFRIDWKLAIAGLLVIPLLVIPTRKVGRTRWQLLKKVQDKSDMLNDIINESLSPSGSQLIKIFVKEDFKNKEFDLINKEVCDAEIIEHRAGSWFRVLMGIFSNIGPICIYLAGGLLMILNISPDLTVGSITVVISLVNRLYKPVQALLNTGVDVTRSMAIFTRIFDYLDKEEKIKDNIDSIELPDNGKAEIFYNHVSFAYDNKEPILKDINFKIPTGATYALVGRSGVGKSTITSLLPRLFDVSDGNVLINGIDVKNIKLKSLRNNIGIVTQEAYLFNGTIKENLLFANENATDEELIEAGKVANIYEHIKNLPDGFNTMVGNKGLKLSGGEKQRLSIARIVLKNPKILILDEATSSLDSISENLIQEALEKILKNRTCIIIAHRLSTILSADKILVIDNGAVAQIGSHKELIKKKGLYKELYETQFSKAVELNEKK